MELGVSCNLSWAMVLIQLRNKKIHQLMKIVNSLKVPFFPDKLLANHVEEQRIQLLKEMDVHLRGKKKEKGKDRKAGKVVGE